MLEELNVRTTMVDGVAYVAKEDFVQHLTAATAMGAMEILADVESGKAGPEHLLYYKGVIETIQAVVMLLTSEEQLDRVLSDLLG